MSGGLRPFHNETHAASSVYFETVFAYFADVIKRTFRALRRRHLNPEGQESLLQLQRQPAKTLDGMLLPSSSGHQSQPPSSTAGLGDRRAGREKYEAWHGSDRRVAGRRLQLLPNLGPCWQLNHMGSNPKSTTYRCVTSGWLLNFSVPGFPYLQNDANNSAHLTGW